jgi:hypothetical protein
MRIRFLIFFFYFLQSGRQASVFDISKKYCNDRHALPLTKQNNNTKPLTLR